MKSARQQRRDGERKRGAALDRAAAPALDNAPPPAPVSFDAGARSSDRVLATAARGTRGNAGTLPHAAAIQTSFGKHDVGSIRAHVGGAAARASQALDATAYATGDDVAFSSPPSLRTAAHEAAHVVQQRGGVQLEGGVGRAGDRYERHADEVADRVVAGESASALLDEMAGGSSQAGVQRKAVQREGDGGGEEAASENEVSASAEVANYKKKLEYRLGTLTVEFKGLAAEASAGADAGTNAEGAEAKVEANAKATLGEFNLGFEAKPIELDMMSEAGLLKLYASVEGMVGVEGAASIEGGVGKMGEQEPSTKPDAGPVYGATASAGGEAFAGAKIGGKAGARFDWRKKAQGSYQGKLESAAEALITVVASGGMGPLLANVATYLLDVLGATEAIAQVLEIVVDWGDTGDVPLVVVEGEASGSAGAGIEGKLEAGFHKGKLSFSAKGGLTWGLGGAGAVKVELDVLQAPLFYLIVVGEMRDEILAWAGEKLEEAWAEGIQLGEAFWGWLDSDDRMVDAVGKGYHKAATAGERARMIDRMLDWIVGDDSEEAIFEVLRYSDSVGDLGAMYSAMNHSLVDLVKQIDGEQWGRLGAWVPSGARWATKVGKLRYPVGGVRHDDPRGPYVYFSGAYNAEASAVSGGYSVHKSYSDDPDFNYYLLMEGLPQTAHFWDTKCEAGHELVAEFYRLEQAWEFRYGSHGIWVQQVP